MTFKAFIFGLLATFGLPWLFAVVIPFAKMRNLEPVRYEDGAQQTGVYSPARAGRIKEGSLVYGQEGCYHCHTQVIRPTYAGNDVHRDEWAGLRKSADNPDTRRETLPNDFKGEKVAYVGNSRVGPDLSNLGRRLDHHLKGTELTPEEWILRHLYNPRGIDNYRKGTQVITVRSRCPSKSGLFKEVAAVGARSGSLPVVIEDGRAIVPTDRAKSLASYLVSLKKDTLEQPLPEVLNHNPEAPKEDQ